MEAVSGKTGRSLRARDLDASWFRKPTMSSSELIFAAEAAAIVGRANLVVATPSWVAMIDARTGEMARDHAPQTLPVFPPRFGDLEGDWSIDLLLTNRNAQAFNIDGGTTPVPLRAISGKAGLPLWEAQGIPAPGVADRRPLRAAALWTLDRPAPGQHFSTADWAWIWPVGAYLAGLQLSAWLVLKAGARLTWWSVRRLFDLATRAKARGPAKASTP